MNYGRFFVLCLESSRLTEGVTVFNYRGLKDDSRDEVYDQIKESPKYPIYVVLSKDGVNFFLHYCKEMDNDVDRDIDKDVKHKHSNGPILSLSISSNLDIKDNITNNLNAIHTDIFPHKDNSSGHDNYLYNLVKTNLKSTETVHKGITYSSLEVFNINYPTCFDDNYLITDFLRKMFLDFLFDLCHTKVFHNVINFEDIFVRLNENFLFKAIRNKAEYYYQRKLINQESEHNRSSLLDIDKKIFLVDYYSDSEQQWVNTIVDPIAEFYFFHSDWFVSIEDEMNNIYVSEKLKPDKALRNSKKHYSKVNKTKSCYDYLAKIKYRKNDKKDSVYKSITKVKYRIFESANIASNWYIHRYNFSGTTRIWFGEGYLFKSRILILLLLLLVIGFTWSSLSRSITGDEIIFPGIIIVLLSCFWWSSLIKAKYDCKSVGRISILMPRLFASIVAAWLTLAIGEDVFKGFFDTIHDVKISYSLLIITFIFIYYEIGKINPYLKRSRKIIRSFTLLLLAFNYSFFIGLLIINFFGVKYIERSDYIEEFYTNNVYIQTPNYTLEDKEQFTHEQFYKIIKDHNPNLLRKIDNLNESMKKSPIYNEFGNDIIVSFSSLNSNTFINYHLTLTLLDAFISNVKDIDDLNITSESMAINPVLRGRVEMVNRRVDSLLELPIKPHFSFVKDQSSYWIYLIKCINSNVLCREVLKKMVVSNDEDNGSKRLLVKSEFIFTIIIFRELLLQFSFFAMFIGIFLQLIFEKQTITDPI